MTSERDTAGRDLAGAAPDTDPAFADLAGRCRELASAGRRILGITGAPGAGKSTLAARLVAELGPDTARLVGMDGFHLSNAVLHQLHRWDRKGAPDTFDADGYLALLRRLRRPDRDDPATRDDPDSDPESAKRVVYAPVFDRHIEESIGSAQPVPAEVPLVITEGNYLLHTAGPWAQVRGLLDECWYVEPPEQQRLDRLVARHMRFGRSPHEAMVRTHGSDQANAVIVQAGRGRADLIIRF